MKGCLYERLPRSSQRGSHTLCYNFPVCIRVQILKTLKVEFESPKLRLMKLAKCLLHIEADVSLHLDQYIISLLDWLWGLWTVPTVQHLASKSVHLEVSCQCFCLLNPAGDSLITDWISVYCHKGFANQLWVEIFILKWCVSQIQNLISKNDKGTDRPYKNIDFLIFNT